MATSSSSKKANSPKQFERSLTTSYKTRTLFIHQPRLCKVSFLAQLSYHRMCHWLGAWLQQMMVTFVMVEADVLEEDGMTTEQQKWSYYNNNLWADNTPIPSTNDLQFARTSLSLRPRVGVWAVHALEMVKGRPTMSTTSVYTHSKSWQIRQQIRPQISNCKYSQGQTYRGQPTAGCLVPFRSTT